MEKQYASGLFKIPISLIVVIYMTIMLEENYYNRVSPVEIY